MKSDDWMADHKQDLPQMSDGARIGSDPLIYLPDIPAWASDRHRLQHWLEREHVDQFLTAVLEQFGLSRQEIVVVTQRGAGKTQAEIARSLQVHRSTISRVHSRALRKLRLHKQITPT